MAPIGRTELLALIIDWFASMLVAGLIFRGRGEDRALDTLLVFAVMTMVLVSLGGASFDHRLMGVRVVSGQQRRRREPDQGSSSDLAAVPGGTRRHLGP